MAHFLNDDQYFTLCALCDTLIPSLPAPDGATDAEIEFWKRSASDYDIPKEVTKTLRDYAPPDQQRDIKRLLTLLAKPASAVLITGKFKAFKDLSFEERERVLQRWSVSQLPQLRQAFQGLKRLTHALFYSLVDAENSNPNWDAVAYPGPLKNTQAPKATLPLLQFDANTPGSYDVIVIGSGAGGAVAAATLAQAGQRVLIVEKGSYHPEHTLSTVESDAYEKLYENAGVLTTKDLGLVVLSGATLGGGTTINWQGSFATPDSVLSEWEDQFGLAGLGERMRMAFPAVESRVGAGAEPTPHNAQNIALATGAERLDFEVAEIKRNALGCSYDDCGWCAFGCIHGAKQSALKTWLPDAVAAGADILVNCEVEKVTIAQNRVTGIQATIGTERVQIKAKSVIVAAGAIHTPAVLLRSGLSNPNIGRNLRLHPVTATRGLYTHKIETWRGPMMSISCDEFVDLDGNGYGCKIETPPAHPGLIAGNWPWLSGYDHKLQMTRMANFAAHIILTRDRGSGQVKLDKRGQPEMHYQLHPQDAKHMQAAVRASLQMHQAAGAIQVGTVHAGLPLHDFKADPNGFDAFLDKVEKEGLRPNHVGLFSAHQMGTARMGHTPKLGAITPDCETWEVSNLYVMDSATFPTASGVNPMITIMAMAYQAATQLADRL